MKRVESTKIKVGMQNCHNFLPFVFLSILDILPLSERKRVRSLFVHSYRFVCRLCWKLHISEDNTFHYKSSAKLKNQNISIVDRILEWKVKERDREKGGEILKNSEAFCRRWSSLFFSLCVFISLFFIFFSKFFSSPKKRSFFYDGFSLCLCGQLISTEKWFQWSFVFPCKLHFEFDCNLLSGKY